MAVFIVVGVGAFQRLGIRSLIDLFSPRDRGSLSRVRLAFLCLPSAVLVSPAVIAAFDLSGFDVLRLRAKLGALFLGFVGATLAAVWVKHRTQAVGFLIVFPFVNGMAWLFWAAISPDTSSFWPGSPGGGHFGSWILFLASTGILAAVVANHEVSSRRSSSRLVLFGALSYAAASLITVAPGYLQPSYSIRDTSTELGRLLRSSASIQSQTAEGLFNGNALRYSYFPQRWTPSAGQLIDVAKWNLLRYIPVKMRGAEDDKEETAKPFASL